jgi:hypothetical protein
MIEMTTSHVIVRDLQLNQSSQLHVKTVLVMMQ